MAPMARRMKYRLALDLGTKSIGWAIFELLEGNDSKESKLESELLDAGVRIFSDSRNPKNQQSLTSVRREAVSARRRRDRFVQRRKYLLAELVKQELFPADQAEARQLAKLDPYKLRAEALERLLTPHEMGRVLFHLNQRRGFRSNRITPSDDEGVVRKSTAQLAADIKESGAETLGVFLWKRRETPQRPMLVRARRDGTKKDDLYVNYPTREIYEQEYDKIWERQLNYEGSPFTGQQRDLFKQIIFFQRKLKAPKVGHCTHFPEELRAPKALASWQAFRSHQDMNHNLTWCDREGEVHNLAEYPDAYRDVAGKLLQGKKLKFDAIRKVLAQKCGVEYRFRFNGEDGRKKDIKGCASSEEFGKARILGKAWHELDLQKKDAFIRLLLDTEKDDEEIIAELKDGWPFSEEQISACLQAKLPKGYGNMSEKAINMLLPCMMTGAIYSDCLEKAGLAPYRQNSAKLHDRLPYYGRVLGGHIANAEPEAAEEEEATRYGKIGNPTVHVCLNQVRLVVNELIRRYGKPHEIVIETARELPLGQKGYKELAKRQKENQETNERIDQRLTELGQEINRDNRHKMLLWEELNKDPQRRCCVFSGDLINCANLFSSNVEVEHIVPRSLYLDDSLSNKTLCVAAYNRQKLNKLPYEAFGTNKSAYAAILERAEHLPRNKRWRFRPDAAQKLEEMAGGDFAARHLNDTRYISRISREYLTAIVDQNRVWVTPGKLTAKLRAYWGLNTILAPRGQAIKNRDDHRHHAVDAVVIGLTTRSVLNRLSRLYKEAEAKFVQRLPSQGLDDFVNREQVQEIIERIVVSHKIDSLPNAQLHNDTAYGSRDFKTDGASLVQHRVPISSIAGISDVDKIKGNGIKNSLLDEIASNNDGNSDRNEIIKEWFIARDIRRVRITENMKVIPIRDGSGAYYKGYKGDSNWAMDIFEYPKGKPKQGQWGKEVISTFLASQSNFEPQWKRDFPAAKKVMRVFRNTVIALRKESGEVGFYRIQQISDKLTLYELFEANADKRSRSSSKELVPLLISSAEKLRKQEAKVVGVSPSGMVSFRKQ